MSYTRKGGRVCAICNNYTSRPYPTKSKIMSLKQKKEFKAYKLCKPCAQRILGKARIFEKKGNIMLNKGYDFNKAIQLINEEVFENAVVIDRRVQRTNISSSTLQNT